MGVRFAPVELRVPARCRRGSHKTVNENTYLTMNERMDAWMNQSVNQSINDYVLSTGTTTIIIVQVTQ